jgi:hypothetical protein
VARAGDAAGLLIVPEPGKALSIDEGPSSFLDSLGNAEFRGLRRADLHRRAHGPCMFSTVYRPFTGRQAPGLVVTSLSPPVGPHGDGEHHVVQIADGDHLDLWLLQRNQQRPRPLCLDVAGRRLETDAAVLYLSLVRGRLARAFRIGGSGAKLDGTAIRVRGSQLTWHKRP